MWGAGEVSRPCWGLINTHAYLYLHRPQKQCNVSETSTIIIIKTIQIYHSVTAMCVISVPSNGKIDITSGDFEDTRFQHIGYPDFVTVENAVQMPLGRGKH